MDDLFDQEQTAFFERVRSCSIRSFEETNLHSSVQVMAEELHKLAQTIPEGPERDAFQEEMKCFTSLFVRHLVQSATGDHIDWNKITSPDKDQIIPYSQISACPPEAEAKLLSKLAVIKLNGGLGTTMGCVGPKSIIEVRDGLTFLDLTVLQIESINKKHNVDVPLVLMNSFNTKDETERVIKKYSNKVNIVTFTQSRFPRIFKDSLMPCPKTATADCPKSNWYPPGHGDLFRSLECSGILDRLISTGKDWIFVSNIDNLGATIDPLILKHLESTGAEFVMEVTDKTKADVKGGTLISYDGGVRLLEIAQVTAEHLDDFKSVRRFKIFNTNNIWISTHAIKRIARDIELEIITNVKSLETGEKVVQLETALGAAIKYFNGAHGINVPRSRFLPVKTSSDLFLVTSDIYRMDHGYITRNPARAFGSSPIVKLGDSFKKVSSYLSRFKGQPKILELDHLTVTGDVTFGSGVVLKGTVIIVASHGSRIDIPSGTILEDKVVTGNLRIMDH